MKSILNRCLAALESTAVDIQAGIPLPRSLSNNPCVAKIPVQRQGLGRAWTALPRKAWQQGVIQYFSVLLLDLWEKFLAVSS